MERYKIIKVVGDGAYGSVYKALNKNTGEIVAIKKMKKKFTSWEECMSLREIKSLRKLSHKNIIKLKEVIRVNDELNFIFEFLEQNVYQVTRDNPGTLTNKMIKSIIKQSLEGLSYMHRNGFFHRDMKPENLMIQNGQLKIADFGLAREIRSKPPYTDYVSTRWYRAPEILLRSINYSSPVDIFALGAIMAELYLLRPLFPGANERDQLLKVCAVLGSPTSQSWPEGHRLASKIGFTFPNMKNSNLQSIIPNAPVEAIDLMMKMMCLDPQKRITANECLEHCFFYDDAYPSKDIGRSISYSNDNYDKPNDNNKPAVYSNNTSRRFSREGMAILNDKPIIPTLSNMVKPSLEKSNTYENQSFSTIIKPSYNGFGTIKNQEPSQPPYKNNSLSYLGERRHQNNIYNPVKIDLPSYNELSRKPKFSLYGNLNMEKPKLNFQENPVFKTPSYYKPSLPLSLRGPQELPAIKYPLAPLRKNMFDHTDPFSI